MNRLNIGLAALASLLPLAADASTINYSTTVSLNPADASGHEYLQYFTGNAPFAVKAGDVITGTISFGSGMIDISGNVSWLDFDFFGNAQTQFSSNVTLLGVSGNLGGSNPHGLSGAGNGVLSAGFGPISNAAGENFSFSGLQYTINVSSVIANGGSVQTSTLFTPSRLDINATAISAVPIPAGGWLLLSGLAGLAMLVRVGRRTASSGPTALAAT